MLWGHIASLQLTGSLLQVDCKENNGWTALMLAANSGREGVAQLLLDRSAEVSPAPGRPKKGGKGQTARGGAGKHRPGPQPHTQHDSSPDK